MTVWAQMSGLNVNCSSAAEEAVIQGNLEVSDTIYTEDIKINDIFDNGQGYLMFYDDLEVQNGEVIKADSYNLNLRGGGDPVVIGDFSVSGSSDDLYVVDDLDVGGTKNCIVEAKDGNTYIFSVIESPEVWFEEKISSKLEKGKKEIFLDNRFIASTVIDKKHPLHIQITPTSECEGLWVEKKSDRVIVHELNGGSSDASFDITISAKRLGFEDIRFNEYAFDADLNIKYKKSNEELFLEQKPLRLKINQLKKERELEIQNSKKKHVEIKNLDKKYNESFKKRDIKQIKEITNKIKDLHGEKEMIKKNIKEKNELIRENVKLILEKQKQHKLNKKR